MDKLKKWFEKKKVDKKFKGAGEGHKLNEARTHDHYDHPRASVPAPSGPRSLTETQQRAAIAAQQRIQQTSKSSSGPSRSQRAIQDQARKELEAEQNLDRMSLATGGASKGPEYRDFEHAPILAVEGVYFYCPLIGEDLILPYNEMIEAIESFLLEQAADEPLLAGATMIQSLNRNSERRQQCVETLKKYLENLIQNPNEEKYKKIRQQNKVFQEKVASFRGVPFFLRSAGFEEKTIDGESYWVVEHPNVTQITLAMDYLDQSEAVPLEVHRNAKIFRPSSKTTGIHQENLPPEFFDRTIDEIKREQTLKSQEVDQLMTMRTKEMRDRDDLKRVYRYRYVLLRIRFPDGYILQGTFRSAERRCNVEECIRQHIAHSELPFILIDPQGKAIVDDEKSLAELNLAPAAVINFKWDPDVEGHGINDYLKEEFQKIADNL